MKISPFFVLTSIISITAVLFVGLQIRKMKNNMKPNNSGSKKCCNSSACGCNSGNNKRGKRILGDYVNETSNKVNRYDEQFNNYFTRMP